MTLELVPGESLGYFKIGMSLASALAIIRANSREIKTANIKYSEEDIEQDVIVEIPGSGYSLYFDHQYQKLTKIVIYNVHLVILSYQKKTFCAPDTHPTYQRIDQTFGPTCDEFRVSNNEPISFVHLYESGGISFCFTVPLDLLDDYPGDKVNGTVINELPPRWAKLEVDSILIADPSQFCNDPGKPLRSVTPEVRVVEGVVGHGIRVCSAVNQNERYLLADLNFYSTPQEVLSQLGPPNRINYKEDDKMRLHHGGTRDTSVDYFYNYFDLGFDILFDGIAHVIRKFILHTNHPSHFNFNRYTKCNFEIVFPESYQTEAGNPVQRARARQGNMVRSAIANDEFDNVDQFKICAETKWEQVLAFLGPSSAKPFMSNREEVNLGGRTKFYGYPNLAIETMKNGYIASICLFSV